MALTTVAVHCGRFYGFDGVALATGSISFRPVGGWIRSAEIKAEFAPLSVSAPLASGDATVTLLAPTDLNDPSVAYDVAVTIPKLETRHFVIRMPVNPATAVPLELSSRDRNQGMLDPQGFGGSADGGFGTSDGGFSSGGGGTTPPADTSATDLGVRYALYGVLLAIDE